MYFFKIKLLYYFSPRHLFKLLCDNIQNIINQVIPQCHFPYFLHQLLLNIHGRKISHYGVVDATLSLFLPDFPNWTWKIFALSIFLVHMISQIWQFWEVPRWCIGVNSWFRNNSILTNMQICLFFSYLLYSFTNQLMNL